MQKPRPKPDYPFRSDGCTFSPNGVWEQCCKAHDLDYWRGGTWRERLASDRRLRDCMHESMLQAGWMRVAWVISRLYFVGVRIGGVGWIPLRRARWGYGWLYPRTGP